MDNYDSLAVEQPLVLTICASLCWLIAAASMLVTVPFLAAGFSVPTVIVFFWGLFSASVSFASGKSLRQMEKVSGNRMAIVVIVGGCLIIFLGPIYLFLGMLAAIIM